MFLITYPREKCTVEIFKLQNSLWQLCLTYQFLYPIKAFICKSTGTSFGGTMGTLTQLLKLFAFGCLQKKEGLRIHNKFFDLAKDHIFTRQKFYTPIQVVADGVSNVDGIVEFAMMG